LNLVIKIILEKKCGIILKNILFKIEKIIYAQADKIIALSPGMKEGVLRVSPEKRVVVVPNMSDCNFFQFEQKKPALESQFGVVGKFVVSYIGSAGPANHLMHLVQLINFCNEKNINNIFFLIQAAGSELNYIQSSIQKNASVKFVEYGNKECVKEVLNISDAVYISFATKPILQTNSPNKFFDALAAGRLSIVNTEGWLKDLIEHEAIGFYVDPFKPETFVEKIQPYLNDKTRLHASQSNARRVAENQYSVNILVKKIIAELE
jgi:glycosyltransferase involved in cell wall biosynthesis